MAKWVMRAGRPVRGATAQTWVPEDAYQSRLADIAALEAIVARLEAEVAALRAKLAEAVVATD